MSAVRASAPFTFIRPAPPLRGIYAQYITIKERRLQIKKTIFFSLDPTLYLQIFALNPFSFLRLATKYGCSLGSIGKTAPSGGVRAKPEPGLDTSSRCDYYLARLGRSS